MSRTTQSFAPYGVLAAGYPKRVTIGASSDLPTLLAVAFSENLVGLAIVPENTVEVRIASGTASANTPLVPSGGIDFPITATEASLLELYAASTTYAMIMAFVPR